MNKFLVVGAIGVMAVTASLLQGCGIFSDRSTEYREAGVMPTIVVPEGIKSGPLEPIYTVPEVKVNEFDDLIDDDSLVVPRPAPMSQDSEFARVKIQKVGDRRWILAEVPTSQVWPLVQSFLARNGILVAKARPVTGEIDTAWLSFKVDASTQSRYHIRIEKGVREQSTEVHVLHQQVAKGQSASAWPVRSNDAEREAWLLDELSVSIAEGISNRAASLLGQSVGGDDKIVLRREGDEPVLDIHLDRERAQATLANALSKEGLLLWSDAAEVGVSYFGYDDPLDEPGFWKKITFRGNDDLPAKAPVELRDLLANMSPKSTPLFGDVLGFTAHKATGKAPIGYLLRSQFTPEKMTVRVRNSRGEPLPYREAKQLMIVIRRNLI